MPFKFEGEHIKPGVPAADCYRNTFGVRLGNGKVTPCTTQGQRAEFVFNDTVKADLNSSGLGVGFGVGLLSKTHSGGIAVPVLAGSAVAAGGDVIVGIADFTIDGETVSLPVAIAASDGDDGDWIVAKATLGSSADAADTDWTAPSLVIEFYDNAMLIVGGETADTFLTFHVNLAAVASGDTVTDFTPGFAGEIIDYQFVVTSPVTTAAKAATFNLEINSTNVTGGALALTSANATPEGKVIAATAITANNTFDENDTISVEASAVTAFVEGEGDLQIRVRQQA